MSCSTTTTPSTPTQAPHPLAFSSPLKVDTLAVVEAVTPEVGVVAIEEAALAIEEEAAIALAIHTTPTITEEEDTAGDTTIIIVTTDITITMVVVVAVLSYSYSSFAACQSSLSQ